MAERPLDKDADSALDELMLGGNTQLVPVTLAAESRRSDIVGAV